MRYVRQTKKLKQGWIEKERYNQPSEPEPQWQVPQLWLLQEPQPPPLDFFAVP